jgi:predicted nucleotidyltransferase
MGNCFMPNHNAIQNLINSRLTEIECGSAIKIVYACESSSRAWGFTSADSDYDVGFIYLHLLEWYLSIDDKSDVIEYPISEQLYINGWDLKKALQLLRKTNPPGLEWLGSPIIYLEKYSIAQRMRQLANSSLAQTATSGVHC